MLINVLSYVAEQADSGGGGMVRRELMETGRRRGHDVRSSCVFPRGVIDAHARADLWLLIDVWNSSWHWHRWHRRMLGVLPWTGIARYRRLLARALKDGPFVHMDNAYVDVCDIGYLPCDGKPDGERCPFKSSRRSSSNRCFRLQTDKLYDEARLQVYVSPLHRDTIGAVRGSRGPELIMRPTLDPRPFQAARRNANRDIPLLFVGSFTEAKGAEEISRRWPGGEVQVVGPLTPEADRYLGYRGPVPHQELPALMARADKFVFMPRWPEPYGRVVSEAVLSGCALVTNGNVGAQSFGRDLADPSLYEGAAEELWERLEEIASPAARMKE